MISQILGFSVLFILALGGMIGAILKFTLHGNVQADVSNRISEERMEDVLNQADTAPDTESSTVSKESTRETVYRVDNDFSNLQPPA